MYKSRLVLAKYACVGSCFASSNCSSAKVSVDKVLVVSKLSRYEFEQYRHKTTEEAELKNRLLITTDGFERIREAHDRHKKYEQKILEALKALRLDVKIVTRLDYNDDCVKWADIVVPVGGDGTFLLAASRVRNNVKPVVGFNSDPHRSEGYLCLPKRYSTNVNEALVRIIDGNYEWLLRNRIRATMTGMGGDLISTNLHEIDSNEHFTVCKDQPTEKILPYLALNEVFIGETMSAKVSNLDIWLNNESYQTSVKCSGLCVSTGTGSTSWHSSINRLSIHTVAELLRLLDMNPTEDENSLATLLADMYNKRLVFSPTQMEIAYTIRDLVSAGVWPKPKGIKPMAFAKKIKVRSKCYDASLVIDGGVSFAFNSCTSVLLEIYQEDALRTVQFTEAKFTIFAIWNTIMGSSLLAMSWGFQMSGLIPGIFLHAFVSGICLYTAQVVLKIGDSCGGYGDVPELCKVLLGKWAEITAKIFSLVVLIGANIVYWILMSNFLYNSVDFIYAYVMAPQEVDNRSVLCPKEELNKTATLGKLTQHSNFYEVWDLYTTVPVFLVVLMFPFLNFKSPTFFTKFNSLGAASVCYMIAFVIVKASNWGIQEIDWSKEIQVKPTFQALSGMLALSYFIHNIIVSVMKSNRNQQHNVRDLSIAYSLVLFTYVFVGALFYISFPLAKSCIEDNFLNNFPKYDPLTIVARLLLLFQLFTVFPLMCFMLRLDIFTNFGAIFNTIKGAKFSYFKVIILNTVIVVVCVLFACFLPRIGTLIRYTGALSGMVYIFALPSLLKIAFLRTEKSLTPFSCIIHVVILLLGILNFCLQFFITDS